MKMSVREEALRRAREKRKEFLARGGFLQSDFRDSLFPVLEGLAAGDDLVDLVDDVADAVDREQLGPLDDNRANPADRVRAHVRAQEEFELLEPFWGEGMTKEQAVAAYYAANPQQPPRSN